MPKPLPRFASLAFEIAPSDSVPNEAHLLPPGTFRAEDGRPEGIAGWQLDALTAQRVIERLRSRKNDTLIDYEHQSLLAKSNGKPVVAAGWFHDMEFRDGKGLYATGIEWTANAKQHIASREYRYISAVFFYTGSGEVFDVVSVALTNTPALDGLDSLDAGELASLTKRFSLPNPETENDDMATPQEELAALKVTHANTEQSLAALTAERDTLKTSLAALTTERDNLKTQVVALTQEKADAAQAAEQQKHTDLLNAALTDGRLTPAQKPWAEKQSLAALSEYLGATNPLPITKPQVGDGHNPQTAALTSEQKKIAESMGVSEADFIATQKKYAQ